MYDPSVGRFISEDPHWNPDNMIYGDTEYKDGETKFPAMTAMRQSSNLYVYGMNNPIKYTDENGESASVILGAVITCVADGLITGGIYKWNGKSFGAGFINGFISCFGTEAGIAIGTATGSPTGVYAGTIIGNSIGSALGSVAEDLMYNPEKSVEEIAKSAAKSAATGILTGVGAAYFRYAIDLANEAGSVAKTLTKYDEQLGKAMQVFFDELSTILTVQ